MALDAHVPLQTLWHIYFTCMAIRLDNKNLMKKMLHCRSQKQKKFSKGVGRFSSVSVLMLLSLKKIQVVGTWKKMNREKIVLEFTRKRDERVKILLYSYITKMDRMEVRVSKNPCAARLLDGEGIQ